MPSRTSLAAAVAAVAALLLPAAAGAATVTVTDGAGQPAQLTPGGSLQTRHMAPVVAATFGAGEGRYSLTVTGPDGNSAGLDAVCASTAGGASQDVTYAGNGAYAVRLVTYEDADDIFCAGAATTQDFTFVIAASVTVSGPASPLLYRDPGGGVKDFTFTYDLNPGYAGYRFVWAYDAQFGADGAIVGDYATGDYDERSAGIPTGTMDDLRFPRAGTVSVVATALAGNAASPFSAPVTLKLIGPFDWSETPGITGGRGTTVRIGGQVFEPGAIGQRVAVRLAKGSGRFKPFVSRTIPDSRKLSFTVKRPRGKYRLKYVFAGAEYVAAGAYTQKLKIGKGSRSVGAVVRVG